MFKPKKLQTALTLGLLTLATSGAWAQNCDNTSVGLVPLTDLGRRTYQGVQGGLYPGGHNTRPPEHQIAGRQLARHIFPRAHDGSPARDGRIVLLSIGMSNTHIEFEAFDQVVARFPNANRSVELFNGAQAGQDATDISDPAAPYWDHLVQGLARAGLSPLQVQAVWLKEAISFPGQRFPDDEFPEDAQRLRRHLGSIVQIIKHRFPNTQQAFTSSRIYAGYATTRLNPEPFAYQSGFAVKFLAADQIRGDPSLNFRPDAGRVRAPWLSWGPYMWADGLHPRSDRLIWQCDDFARDGTHPNEHGARKVARQLLHHFAQDSTTRPWFVRCPADFDNNGHLNTMDFLAFLNAFQARDISADFNGNGHVGSRDLLAFLDAFDHGCPGR